MCLAIKLNMAEAQLADGERLAMSRRVICRRGFGVDLESVGFSVGIHCDGPAPGRVENIWAPNSGRYRWRAHRYNEARKPGGHVQT